MFRAYLESGLGIIPVLYGKNPGFQGWQRYCEELPTEQQVAEWERNHPSCNIGLPCGPANNIICLDIDTEIEDVKNICPPSPVRKVGKKGEARFFQYNPDIISTSFGVPDNPRIGSIDLLSNGRQTVLPPSIHPDTRKPYTWITIDRFPGFRALDLPKIALSDIDKIADYFNQYTPTGYVKKKVQLSGIFVNEDPNRQSPHGSQDRLKNLAAFHIHLNDKTTDECVEILLHYDRTHHFPVGYFYETGRTSDQKADPHTNALRFFISIKMSINQQRLKDGLEPLAPTPSVIQGVEISLDSIEERSGYPEPRGLMKEVRDLADSTSFCDTSILNLGGAISLMAVLASNRVQSIVCGKKVTPNTYALNVGLSGVGKDEIQKILREILSPYRLLGPAVYKSDSGFAMDLPEQPERLDIIDEATSLLKLSSSKNSHEAGLGDLITQLYSCASSMFEGISSKAAGSKSSRVIRPHVSILGSTTPAGFKAHVSETMMLRGLMPRFMVFHQINIGEAREPEASLDDENVEAGEGLLEAIKEKTRLWIEDRPKWNATVNEQNILEKSAGNLKILQKIPFEKNARQLWWDFKKWTLGLISKNEDSNGRSEFFARWAENAAKLALLDACSLARHTICVDSVEWGISLIKAQWEASKELYDSAAANNPIQEYVDAVLRCVKRFQKKNPGKPISRAELTKRLHLAVDKRIRDSAYEFIKDSQILHFKTISGVSSQGRATNTEMLSLTPFID